MTNNENAMLQFHTRENMKPSGPGLEMLNFLYIFFAMSSSQSRNSKFGR